ncbi:MAG: hypothetical protein IPG96_11885 [Proteobacteria bacterium]|nr:hypothetical protein [Pseudomonadota bacterium]
MSEREQHPVAGPSTGVEPDALPIRQIAGWVLALLAVVGALTVALWQYFDAVSQREVVAQDLSQVPPALPELRARDRQLLTHYEVVDAARGRFRVPISRAIELLAAQPALIAPLEVAATPAPEPSAPPRPTPPPAPPQATR